MDYGLIIILIGIISSIVSIVWFIWYCWERIVPIRRISWKKAEKSATKFANRLAKDGFSPTIIIGIGRGGAIMGAFVSGCLGYRPLFVIDHKYIWRNGRRVDDMIFDPNLPPALLERVLLIGGETHTGNTMRLYYDYLKECGARQIKRATFYYQQGCTEPVEYKGIESNKELLMPWMFSKDYVRDSRSEEEAKKLSGQFRDYAESHSGLLGTCYLIRHGQSADNATGDRYSGITDSLLTDQGKKEAVDIGRALQNERIDIIYCSPMKRAVETARTIQMKTGGMLVIDPRLREMDYGDWEGLTRQEVFQRWPDFYNDYKKNPIQHYPQNGESPEKTMSRIKTFWEDLQKTMVSELNHTVVLVTHKSIGRILLCYVTRQSISGYREYNLDNGSISKILLEKSGGSQVVYKNKTDHLTTQY